MIWLSYLAFLLAGIRFFTAGFNLLFSPVLKHRTIREQDKLISIIIPARNEENNIENILQDLLNQNYKNTEIVVFDDESEDRTASKVLSLAEKHPNIRLLSSQGLKKGWLGKNHACHHASLHASGEYLVFIDADVRLKPIFLESALAHFKKHRLSLMSIFPVQKMQTFGEKISVPLMNQILLSLLPMRFVRTVPSFASLSAANGQFMLFKAAVYQRYLPHKQFRTEKVEDIAIARFLKKNKEKIDCLTGNSSISCRMYQSFSDAVQGFSKNIADFFGGSFALCITYWMTTAFGFIPVLMVQGREYALALISAQILTRLFISISSKQSAVFNILSAPLQQISTGIVIFAALRNTILKKNTWKGRNILSQ